MSPQGRFQIRQQKRRKAVKEAYIIDAVRTPRGRQSKPKKNFVGEFANIHPAYLGAALVDALLERNPSIPPDKIEEVIFAVTNPMNEQGANLARTVTLTSKKLPVTSSGVTVNRACSGALQANAFARACITLGDYDIVMAGGVEHMNMVPIEQVDSTHLPFPLETITRHNMGMPGAGAELMCEKYKPTQQEIDEFSVRSHKLADAATKAGKFKNEIIPIPYTDQEGKKQVLDWDSSIRPDSSVEAMAKLSRPFKPQGGMIHAGNSSAVVDGAAMSLWASKEACKEYGLKPWAKILVSVNIGCKPDIMLEGPMPGTEMALKRAGMKKEDIEYFEINEAFACVPVAWMKMLNIPIDKVNLNGGAIAMGHPLGATGGILLATMLNEMDRRDLRIGLITMCAAYGQSGTMIIERVKR
jgi:acetyl-CoA acyltransferase